MKVGIDPNAIYITPRGRRCKWVPLGGPQRTWTAHAYFVYLDGHSALKDGFTLTAANYGVLRKEGDHAAPR